MLRKEHTHNFNAPFINQPTDFLPSDLADRTQTNILNSPPDWFPYAVKTSPMEVVYSKEFPRNITPLLIQDQQQGNFCYRFRRTTPHTNTCQCWWCDFRENYLQKNFLTSIKKLTHLKNPELREVFISKYSAGDFLGIHHDDKKGDIAFVLNLTRNWKPEWGGNLMIQSGPNSWVTLSPKFNSIILLDVHGEGGHNHLVTEVTQAAPHDRIAITGWVSEEVQ